MSWLIHVSKTIYCIICTVLLFTNVIWDILLIICFHLYQFHSLFVVSLSTKQPIYLFNRYSFVMWMNGNIYTKIIQILFSKVK